MGVPNRACSFHVSHTCGHSGQGEFENMLHHHQQQHQQHQRSQPQLVARACLLGRWGPGIMNAGKLHRP
eukprot:5427239-Amphidinium_carterae.1